MGVATAAALLVAVPPVAASVGLYRAVNGAGSVGRALDAFFHQPWMWVSALVLGIVIHELVHGVAWALRARQPLSIIRFGINWKALAPHAQCTVPLPASIYRFGAAAPGVLLGVVPAMAGALGGSGAVAVFGWLMILGAGGDLVVLWLIRSLRGGVLVRDHPTRAGCVVVGEPSRGDL
jgi:hypothetical protein